MRVSDGLTFSLQENFLDDSGIGMSFMGDENELPQFTFPGAVAGLDSKQLGL